MNKMKSVGIEMNLLMGITMSFFESLTGMLSSGHFSLPGWMVSFAVSSVVSIIIGLVVPMKKIGDAVTVGRGMKRGSIGARLVESLVSDLIYTPLLTFIMVGLAYHSATAHGAKLQFMPMFLSSLVLCMAVGFVLIFIFQPLYMRLVFKINKISVPEGREGKP